MLRAEIDLALPCGQSQLRLTGLTAVGPARSRLMTMAQNGSGQTAVVIGRLHYHADLRRRCGLALDPDSATAAEWVLATFGSGGTPALNRLEGEFGLILHDQRSGTVRLQRSPVGDVPLYYAPLPQGGWTAGTNLQAVASRAGCRRIREDFLAGFLVNTYRAEIEADDATVFEGVRRVLPGSRVVLAATGIAAREWEWDWLGLMTGANRLPRSEAAKQYLELLDGSIRERVNCDRTAAHHSGGFDSSAIVCRARDQIAAGKAPGPLTTISLDYPFAEMAGEGKYMRLVTDAGGPIDPIYVRDDAALDFDGFPEQVPPHDEPAGYLFRAGLDRQMIALARHRGARTLLCGAGAELLTEPALDYITDLTRAGQWRAAAAEAKRWAAARQTYLGALMWQHALRPRLPAALRAGITVWWRHGRAVWPRLETDMLAPWVRPAFARRTRAFAHAVAVRRQIEAQDVERQRKIVEIRSSVSTWSGWYLALQSGSLALSHPFLDPRLLAFGLSLQRDVRQEPGVTKPLLAEATRGILPEPIRTRRHKIGFDRVNLEGFRRAMPRLRALVACAPEEYFDRDELRRGVECYAQGQGHATVGVHINAALSLIVWLQQQHNSGNRNRPELVYDLGWEQLAHTSLLQRRA